MNRKPLWAVLVVATAASIFWAGSQTGRTVTRAAEPAAPADADPRIGQLQEQVKQLQALVPDQAAVMTHVGYHFGNLWVAIQHENWPLADFYQGEALNNIKWAVRAKPFRKAPDGTTIDLGGIAQAIENTQFAQLKKAIAARKKDEAMQAYTQTLQGCYACHVASGKPYLKPHPPADSEVRIINFDPDAKVP